MRKMCPFVLVVVVVLASSHETFAAGKHTNVCEYVADYSNKDRLNEIILNVEEGKADINNDGIPDRFVIFDARHEGMRIDVYFNGGATSGSFALENIDGFETWRIRVLPFEGKTYLLYENLPVLVQVTLVQPMKEKTMNTGEILNVESRVCRFGQKIEKRIKKSQNKSLCEFAAKGDLQYPKFSEPHLLTVESLNRADTYPEKLACQIDIDNDGKPEQLVRLNFSSGEGTGCGNDYLAILNNAKDGIV